MCAVSMDCLCLVKVSAARFSTVVGYLKFTQRGYDLNLTTTVALLPAACVLSACLLTMLLFCMWKSRSLKRKQKPRSSVDVSYVQCSPSSGGVLPSLSHWPLRQQPSPLLSRQYLSSTLIILSVILPDLSGCSSLDECISLRSVDQ